MVDCQGVRRQGVAWRASFGHVGQSMRPLSTDGVGVLSAENDGGNFQIGAIESDDQSSNVRRFRRRCGRVDVPV